MDDLHIAFDLESFVVLGDENDHSILNEQIAMLALDGVAMSYA